MHCPYCGLHTETDDDSHVEDRHGITDRQHAELQRQVRIRNTPDMRQKLQRQGLWESDVYEPGGYL